MAIKIPSAQDLGWSDSLTPTPEATFEKPIAQTQDFMPKEQSNAPQIAANLAERVFDINLKNQRTNYANEASLQLSKDLNQAKIEFENTNGSDSDYQDYQNKVDAIAQRVLDNDPTKAFGQNSLWSRISPLINRSAIDGLRFVDTQKDNRTSDAIIKDTDTLRKVVQQNPQILVEAFDSIDQIVFERADGIWSPERMITVADNIRSNMLQDEIKRLALNKATHNDLMTFLNSQIVQDNLDFDVIESYKNQALDRESRWQEAEDDAIEKERKQRSSASTPKALTTFGKHLQDKSADLNQLKASGASDEEIAERARLWDEEWERQMRAGDLRERQIEADIGAKERSNRPSAPKPPETPKDEIMNMGPNDQRQALNAERRTFRTSYFNRKAVINRQISLAQQAMEYARKTGLDKDTGLFKSTWNNFLAGMPVPSEVKTFFNMIQGIESGLILSAASARTFKGVMTDFDAKVISRGEGTIDILSMDIAMQALSRIANSGQMSMDMLNQEVREDYQLYNDKVESVYQATGNEQIKSLKATFLDDEQTSQNELKEFENEIMALTDDEFRNYNAPEDLTPAELQILKIRASQIKPIEVKTTQEPKAPEKGKFRARGQSRGQ